MSEQVKMYVTTYALTSGIYECFGEITNGHFRPANLSMFCTIGRDCFPTFNEAIEKSRAMAQCQLKILETKKQKLNTLLDTNKFKIKKV